MSAERPLDPTRRNETGAEFFMRRANQERAAAIEAAGPEARRAHHELALRYMDLARGICNQKTSKPL